MWNSCNDNDILDFVLLWDPLGGPAPENVATAFSIDMSEYNHRLRGATKFQLARLERGTACSGQFMGCRHLQRSHEIATSAGLRTSPDLVLGRRCQLDRHPRCCSSSLSLHARRIR